MILSGQTIRRYCDDYVRGWIGTSMIEPFFERRSAGPFKDVPAMTYGVGPAGYDVRLEFDESGSVESQVIRPGGFMLASTIERFRMPPNVLGMVADKSTWARKGIAVQNTVIEPGWEGWLTLEITNHGDSTITLERGMPIAQIIFHFVDENVIFTYDGKYHNQGRGPREAK